MKYLLITEAALDLILIHRLFENGAPHANAEKGLFSKDLSDSVRSFATTSDSEAPYCALISIEEIEKLNQGSHFNQLDLFGRIARVVKSLATPPIHLPRHWAEFHFQNRLAFFALPRTTGNFRWIVDTDSDHRCARFAFMTDASSAVDLQRCELSEWPSPWTKFAEWLPTIRGKRVPQTLELGLGDQFDLAAIGSGSVVQNRTYDGWQEAIKDEQRQAVLTPVTSTVRIVGPAGSGKTLTLCLRAIRISMEESIQAEGKRILFVTHSWAMAERIDGILQKLASGTVPKSITVLPLLYLLEIHGGQVGRDHIDIVGDDSQSGRIATIEILHSIVDEIANDMRVLDVVNDDIRRALVSARDSRLRADLILDIYEEFTGVIGAQGISIDNATSMKSYLEGEREDWMPPFAEQSDRKFMIRLYRRFLTLLADRGAITTDQFVADTIKVLETFTWRMRRETEGYDYIFIDELQLFDSQERLALELVGRSSIGTPFSTAEDPSQGVFSALNRKGRNAGVNTSIYLESVHRFEQSIFEFIKYIYFRFPLNTIPLRIGNDRAATGTKPELYQCDDDSAAILCSVNRALQAAATQDAGGESSRVCVVTLGDADQQLLEQFDARNTNVIELRSFDDVEKLSYRKRSIVVAPWQFIGGTQFTSVIVLVAGMPSVTTAFGRLRELTAMYLACSRATQSLQIVCGTYRPAILSDAVKAGLVREEGS